jgi:hypothetical protein
MADKGKSCFIVNYNYPLPVLVITNNGAVFIRKCYR